MAAVIVQRAGNSVNGGGTANPLSTTMSAYTAGTLLVLVALGDGGPNTVTGPSGWTAGPYASASNCDVGLWWRLSSGASTTVTITGSGAPGPSLVMEVYEVAGLTNVIDQMAHNSGAGSGTSLATGTTGALASSSQLCIAAFAGEFSSEFVSAYTNGYTELDGRGASTPSTWLNIASLNSASTAAQSCTATVTSSAGPSAIIATFPTAGSAGANVVQHNTVAVQTQSTTVTLNAAPTAGNLLVIAVASNGGTDNQIDTPTGWSLAPHTATVVADVYLFYRVAGIGESTTIATVNYTTTGQPYYSLAVISYELSGFTANSFNVGASVANGSGATSLTTGTTATTAQSDELCIAAYGIGQQPNPITSYTSGYVQQDTVTDTFYSTTCVVAFHETASTGAQSCTATSSVVSGASGATIATFKVGTAGGLSAPSNPTNVTAVPGNAQATVSWTLPADDGGSAIIDYSVTAVLVPNTVTYSPTIIPISAAEIANTGRGQYEWNGAAGDPAGWPLRDVYWRDEINWARDLETSQGVYNSAVIDSGLARAHSMGGRFGFRVMAVNNDTNYTPSYVARQSGNSVPDWNSSSFLNAYTNLMAHLGSLYNSDPRLAFVDMGGYGNWGEWHTYYLGGSDGSAPFGPSITSGNAQTIINAVTNAFPSKHVLMMTAGAGYLQQAMSTNSRIGVRIDCIGATQFYGSPIDSVPDAVNRWTTAPFVSEWCSSTDTANEYATGDTQVQQYHFSMLASDNYPTRYANMSGAQQTSFQHANKISGYRINLTNVVVPGSVVRGNAFSMTSHWNNANVAPPYDDWSVQYQLRAGTTVVWTSASALNTKTLMPGATTVVDTFTVPTGVSSGTYTLAVKVVDPAGSASPMALAQNGVNADNSYSLGSVVVT